MTKRSTEDVLRSEVRSAAKAVDAAKKRLAAAADARAEADRLEATREVELDQAKASLGRAEKALDAFLPVPLEELIEKTKERAATTGTHDPADLAEKDAEA